MYDVKQYPRGIFYNKDCCLYLEFQMNPPAISREKTANYNAINITGFDSIVDLWSSGGPYNLSFDLTFDSRPYARTKTSQDDTDEYDNIPINSENKFSMPIDLSHILLGTGVGMVQDSISNMSEVAAIALQVGRRFIKKTDDPNQLTDMDNQNTAYDKLTKQYALRTIDHRKYDPTMGVYPYMAIIESFLRPAFEGNKYSNFDSKDTPSLMKLYDQDQQYLAPPRCMFIFGNRIFETKMKSAPIKEEIYNQNLIPERVSFNITLEVVETSVTHLVNDEQRKYYAVSGLHKNPFLSSNQILSNSNYVFNLNSNTVTNKFNASLKPSENTGNIYV